MKYAVSVWSTYLMINLIPMASFSTRKSFKDEQHLEGALPTRTQTEVELTH